MRRCLPHLLLAVLLLACSKGEVEGDGGGEQGDGSGPGGGSDAFGNAGETSGGGGAPSPGVTPGGPGSQSGVASGCNAHELCGDGLDGDCDGLADEGCSCADGAKQPCYDGPLPHAGVGACNLGVQRCAEQAELPTWQACEGARLPAEETCDDEVDDDCDGRADEGCVCTPPDTRDCYGGPERTREVGACRDGTLRCVLHDEVGTWDDECESEVTPRTERCGNDVDEDCDGELDNDCICSPGDAEDCYPGPDATRGVGECSDGFVTCEVDDGVAELGKECMDAVMPAEELCGNDDDENCDGELDDGCTCKPGETDECYTGPDATRGVGACHDGTVECEVSEGLAEWGVDCAGDQTPEDELCGNEVDEDCDGNLDNGCVCTLGQTEDCYPGADDTRGVGACQDGELHCVIEDGVAVWGTECEDAVIPTAEVCGNDVDEDCDDELDDGCGELACPEDMVVPAGSTVNVLPDGTNLVDYVFAITDGPAGGADTASWYAPDPDQPSAELIPYIVGEYTVQISATDGTGAPFACSFGLTAMPHGLRVQLSWDGTGDVDLHLHNDNATPWFHDLDDCHWRTRQTTWGAVLDFDDIPGPGPENIALDTPVIGASYYVGVHHWGAAAGRIATVELFCGDSDIAPAQTFVSHPLVGTDSARCTQNDFWRVARVSFTSATECTIETIDDYVPSATACTML